LKIWPRIGGVGMVVVGVVWIRRRSVGVGIEGREPAFFVKGRGAVLIGAVTIGLGLVIALFADQLGME
jgi:hypothetical protein